MNSIEDIGFWSEIKLDIIRDYAAAYSRILTAQTRPKLSHVYIDAFAGAGIHRSRKTQEFVAGSPLNALNVRPPFKEYFFIDLDNEKVQRLEKIAGQRENVHLFHGDCNDILLKEIFPRVQYDDYRRGLCLLDPYGLHVSWDVIYHAGKMRSIEIFLNFSVLHINRNILLRNRKKVVTEQTELMNRAWGDESWNQIAYSKSAQGVLFGDQDEIKITNDNLAQAFKQRLKNIAGFKYVPDPLPVRNEKNAILYYLFFASHNFTGEKIIKDIFSKYSL